jgi:hypothetical protein
MLSILPAITPKQQEILKLIYNYRFLSRTQIQALLSHKDKRRIITWLKDLREKEYIDWQYDATHFMTKSQPAIYYLSINGIRHLHNLNKNPIDELRKRYKDSSRTKVFINRSLLIADCCITLIAKNSDKVQYTFILPADYTDPRNPHNYLNELKPHLYLSRHRNDDTMRYLLENFEESLPRYQLRKRLKDYIQYLNDADNSNSLVALFVCANTSDLQYVKRSVKKLFEDNNEQTLHVRITTLDKIKMTGAVSEIWEEIRFP